MFILLHTVHLLFYFPGESIMKQKASERRISNNAASLIYGIDLIDRSFWDAAYTRLNTDRRFTANTLEMIEFISRNPKCSQDDISRELCIDKGCVAKGMLYLEQHEFIHRKRSDADRRAYELTLLQAGRKASRDISKFADEWFAQISGSVDPADLEAYYRVMNSLNTGFSGKNK